MSAARWRRTMNTGLSGAAVQTVPTVGLRAAAVPGADSYAHSNAHSHAPRWLKFIGRKLGVRHIAVLAFVLLLPFVVSPFLTYQVAAQALIFGLIALSLSFLAGYGGMVSQIGRASCRERVYSSV